MFFDVYCVYLFSGDQYNSTAMWAFPILCSWNVFKGALLLTDLFLLFIECVGNFYLYASLGSICCMGFMFCTCEAPCKGVNTYCCFILGNDVLSVSVISSIQLIATVLLSVVLRSESSILDIGSLYQNNFLYMQLHSLQ